MRLAIALLRKRMPGGHIFRGKYRLVREVTGKDIASKRIDYAIEEQNMFYLRHSFLTPEQSKGHTKALGKQEKRMEKLINERYEDYFRKPHTKLEHRLGYLKYQESWE